MNFKLTINCDNAAFGNDEEHTPETAAVEIGRILRDLSLEYGRIASSGGNLRDINGNRVGRFDLSYDDAEA